MSLVATLEGFSDDFWSWEEELIRTAEIDAIETEGSLHITKDIGRSALYEAMVDLDIPPGDPPRIGPYSRLGSLGLKSP